MLDAIKGQFRSVIEWENPSEKEIFIKITDNYQEIQNASKLIVQAGQGCILTYEGKVVEVIREEGMYDLKTGNSPFVTAFKKFLKLQAGSEHILGIWFFRKADILTMRWGTKVPISYKDPVYTFPILLSAFGNYSVRITEPLAFFKNILAGQNSYRHRDLKDLFLSRIGQPITNYLANAKFSYVDIDAKLNEIASNTKDATNSIFSELGFQLLDFRIEGTQFDQDTLDRIGNISNMQSDVQAAKLAGIDYVELEKLRAMRDAAKNEGVAGATMGMFTGMQMGNTMNEVSQQTTKEVSPKEDDLKTKLIKLKELFEMELISKEEYEEKRKVLLENL